ncbi:hypothetical protein HY440_01385 [Candidatus Microgenomates bacterium]|nr:hypothetical protein [Candidatus Microgenomates bacterium]
MRKVVIKEGGREVSMAQLRNERLKRPGANRLHPTQRRDSLFTHPAAVTLRLATQKLAEPARRVAGLASDDSSFKVIRDDFDAVASNVNFAQAREQARRVYKANGARQIIHDTLATATGVDETEKRAIERILLTIRVPRRSSSRAKN